MTSTGETFKDYVLIKTSSYLTGRTGETLEKEFEKNLMQGRRKFIVNFKDTEIINSIGVSFLIGIIEKIIEYKGSIYFMNLSSVNEEIFRMMGLLHYAPLLTEEQIVF